MAQVATLSDAVAELIGDGDPVATEGFTQLIPFAVVTDLGVLETVELTLTALHPGVEASPAELGALAELLAR